MIADFEYTSQPGMPVTSRMVNHVNVVDGIFSEQVGVAIVPTDFITFATDTDPFTSNNPSTLLDQVAELPPEQRQQCARAGLAHLLTGRELTATSSASRSSARCASGVEGVSLSESSSS